MLTVSHAALPVCCLHTAGQALSCGGHRRVACEHRGGLSRLGCKTLHGQGGMVKVQGLAVRGARRAAQRGAGRQSYESRAQGRDDRLDSEMRARIMRGEENKKVSDLSKTHSIK